MANQKQHGAGEIFKQFGGFVLRFTLKAIALALWVVFKLISGITSAITSLLENYLDI